MAEDPSRLLAGRIILSGMVSLFVGLALIRAMNPLTRESGG
jgi:hypothetical protein